MKKQLFSGLCVAALLFCCAVPCFAEAASSSSVASASSDSVDGAGRSEALAQSSDGSLDGAESVVDNVTGTMDSAYDNMPQQDSGTLAFLSAFVAGVPLPIIMACTLVLVLSLVLMLLRFLWK